MILTKDSSIVGSWVRLVKNNIMTMDQVPNLFNLREVVAAVLKEDI